MGSQEIRLRLLQLREDVWQLARDSLDSREPQIYRTLVDFAERLTSLASTHIPTSLLGTESTNVVAPTELRPIFVRYKGENYDARLDSARINGGRGKCVLFQSEWLTASRAANRITGTSVNGWRFWKARLDNGKIITIEDLK